MPNPTFQAIISAVNESRAAFVQVKSDLAGVRREANATKDALVKLDRPGALSQLGAAAQSLHGSFGAVGGQINKTRGAIASLFPAIGALAAVSSIPSLFALVSNVANARTEFNATAQRVGLSAAALGKFNLMAKLTGVDVETMQGGLGKMSKTLGEVAVGKGKAAAAILQRLGFSLKDIKSGAVTAEQVIPRLGDAFAKTKNEALKAYVATTLAGRGGLALMPIFNQTAAQQEAFKRRTAGLSYGFTKEDLASLDEYRKSMILLDTSVKGFTNEVAAKLAPVMRPMVDQMTAWIAANRSWIASGITDAVTEFSDWIKAQDWSGVIRDIGALARGVKSTVDFLGGFKVVMEGVIAYKLASWAWAAASGIGALAVKLEAIGASITAIAAAAGTVPAWAVWLMSKGGPIGIGVYAGSTIGSGPNATQADEEQIRKDALGKNYKAPVTTDSFIGPMLPPKTFGENLGAVVQAIKDAFPATGTRPPEADRGFVVLPAPPGGGQPKPERAQSPGAPMTAPLPWASEPWPSPGGGGRPTAAQIFPSPYAIPNRAGAPVASATPPESRLRIQIDIPNLPEGAKVEANVLSGPLPEPEINVGRSNPLLAY